MRTMGRRGSSWRPPRFIPPFISYLHVHRLRSRKSYFFVYFPISSLIWTTYTQIEWNALAIDCIHFLSLRSSRLFSLSCSCRWDRAQWADEQRNATTRLSWLRPRKSEYVREERALAPCVCVKKLWREREIMPSQPLKIVKGTSEQKGDVLIPRALWVQWINALMCSLVIMAS